MKIPVCKGYSPGVIKKRLIPLPFGLLLLILLSGTIRLNAEDLKQSFKVSGVVTASDSKEPLPGVNVTMEGTTLGTVSDQNGKYTIDVPDKNATLVFSYLGYTKQIVKVEGRAQIDIMLQPDVQQLSELVVVGYATQKKVNLTGAVSSINSEDIKQAPVSSVAQSMMGRMPGMIMKNISGQPGNFDAVKFSVRGFGSPLLIIDGMPANNEQFVQLDPNDVENISVLKDAASAAVYGARAGNGVILVTTKRGKSLKPQISYSGNYSLQAFTNPPEFASSYELAVMENIGYLNENKLPYKWSDEQIQKFKDGSDPAYPNTDWFNEVFLKYAPQSQHNLSIQGGTENVKYFISGGYLSQDGMYRSGDLYYKRYNLRSNVDVNITKKFSIGTDLSINASDINSPPYDMGRGSNPGVYHSILRSQPYWPKQFPDPTKVPFSGYMNPVYMSDSDYSGYKNTNRVLGDVKLKFAYILPLGFEAKAVLNYKRSYFINKERRREFQIYTYDYGSDVYTLRQNNTFSDSRDAKSLLQSTDIVNEINQQYFLTWKGNFGKHNLSALGVWEINTSNYNNMSAWRLAYDNNLEYLFAGPDLNKDNNGSAGEDGRMGYITRFNYDYSGKYLFEFNSRYDGSSRFSPENRWGFFPSVSLGWRISEEGFFKNKVPLISNLKLRGSLGKSGFDNIAQYEYLDLFRFSNKYIFDQNLERSIQYNVVSNASSTWEKMTTQDIGLDLGLWDNSLTFEFDWFYRERSDVLTQLSGSVPDVVGAKMPKLNYSKYDNRGFDLMVTYKNSAFNDFNYEVSGNFTWTREKTILTDQPVYANEEERRRKELNGQWTNRLWGYQSDGLFKTQEEIETWADQDGKNNATILPGDIKYKDVNGDGKIDDADQTIIGRGSTPEILFGVNVNLSYKGFDLNMLWQGATNFNYNLMLVQETFRPFYADSWMWKFWYKEAWTPENPWTGAQRNGYYPRYRSDQTSRNHSNWNKDSDYWMTDATYVRLKTIELGYTFSPRLLKVLKVDKFRVYVSGYNLLTFSSCDLLDPEIEVDRNVVPYPGMYYPQTKVYNVGVTLTF